MEGNGSKRFPGVVIKEEMRAQSSGSDKEVEYLAKVGNQSEACGDISPKRPSSDQTDSKLQVKEDNLETTKAEMGEVREENERLKTVLARIVKDYKSLQMHFFDTVQQEEVKKSTDINTVTSTNAREEHEEPEFFSLSLGRSTTSSEPKRDEKSSKFKGDDDGMKEGLALGLDCKFEVSTNSSPNNNEPVVIPSPENSSDEHKEGVVGEQWPPSKNLKRNGDEDLPQQTHVKKARVSVRARCDTPTMNDGCQWRKYGQKIAKGNPCPRAYYRCTVATACPVRKQVQRCAEDMSILITTYEGTHNHPLPISATAMASTTSAAACMLMSGSTSSRTNPSNVADLHGLNFNLTDNSRGRQFYLPNSSISTPPPYPTITLDLTTPSLSSSSMSQFNRSSSNFGTTPRYSPTSFNFSSSESNNLPITWGNGYLNYGSHSYNKNQMGSLNLGRQPQEQFYHPYVQKSNPSAPPQQSLTDSITAATKAITADPSFRSALAAAITSIVGGNTGASNGNQGGVEGCPGQNLKWGEAFPSVPTYSSSPNGNACATSYMNRTSSSSSAQQASLMFLPPSLPFSATKSASASPVDDRDHIN
ncbi:hypothetical protein GIB67_033042 [Kingdonia uniflora]|uniref:WRKY domain-containing protein n=1 Tax=Kingdonia uniflora TaxID=39325 RepID=A0A7J7MZ38_9MAGN|nr:hypothetical protein GIB67_033042 [Kingdonia uniflora]